MTPEKLEVYLGHVRELPSYGLVTLYDHTAEGAHFFNCCLLVREIYEEVGDIDEVWNYVGKNELSNLEIFMDPKKLSSIKRIGEMLYRFEDNIDLLRGRFNKTALTRLSERGTEVQEVVISTELSGPDQPSNYSIKRFEGFCDTIEKDLGRPPKRKTESTKTPYESIAADIRARFKVVEMNLKSIRESINRADFKQSIDQLELTSLHELIGAFDAEILRVKDTLRSTFKEHLYERRRK